MTATNEAWIQDSITRLEQLEAQREQLRASGRGGAELAELDEEIRSLYEVLEAAADDAPSANEAPEPAPARAAAVQPESPFASPFAAAPIAAPPIHATPSPLSFSQPTIDTSIDDEPKSGNGMLIAVLALVVLGGGGAGGWWYMQKQQAPAPAAAPAGPATVIQAGAIPEDTQEPEVAKGGDATRTPAQVIKERPDGPDRRPASRPSSSGSSRPSASSKSDSGRSSGIQGAKDNDPLAGLK